MFKRKHKLSREQLMANAINNCVTSILERYKNTPLKVEHRITRNIPKPAKIIIWCETAEGQRYHMGWLDLSYKHTAPMILNIGMLGGPYMAMPPIQLYMEAQYDKYEN